MIIGITWLHHKYPNETCLLGFLISFSLIGSVLAYRYFFRLKRPRCNHYAMHLFHVEKRKVQGRELYPLRMYIKHVMWNESWRQTLNLNTVFFQRHHRIIKGVPKKIISKDAVITPWILNLDYGGWKNAARPMPPMFQL